MFVLAENHIFSSGVLSCSPLQLGKILRGTLGGPVSRREWAGAAVLSPHDVSTAAPCYCWTHAPHSRGNVNSLPVLPCAEHWLASGPLNVVVTSHSWWADYAHLVCHQQSQLFFFPHIILCWVQKIQQTTGWNNNKSNGWEWKGHV